MSLHLLRYTLPHPIRGDMLVQLLEPEILQEFSGPEGNLLRYEMGGCLAYIVQTWGSKLLPLRNTYAGKPIRIILIPENWAPAHMYADLVFSVWCLRRSFLRPFWPAWQPLNLADAPFILRCLENSVYHFRTRLGWMEKEALDTGG